jgi:hypothetical protein
MTSPVMLRSGMVGVATAGNPSDGILAQFVPLACRELATAHVVTETKTVRAPSTGILAYPTPSVGCENHDFRSRLPAPRS